MAKSDVVSHSSEPIGRFSIENTTIKRNVEATAVSGIPLEPRVSGPTRVDHIKQRILADGFSEEVARRASQPQRKSSLKIYQSHYSTFCDWCTERGVCAQSVTVQLVADYFVYMFTVLQRQVATIANHRSALASVLGKFDGVSISDHPVISSLFSNFWAERPQVRLRIPDWELTFVLSLLMKDPFEPPRYDTVEQKKFTTWKTAFLLALASAKRASDLYGLSRDVHDLRFSKDGVWLRTIPGFLAKTQRPNSDSKPFFIPSHQHFAGEDTLDRLLCPVRMLKYYLRFTNGHKNNERLFLKCSGEGFVLTKTISSWLKKLIMFCYESKGRSIKAKGHEVRKMATSWAFAGGAAVNDILLAASWRSTTTFTSHYLVDLQTQLDGNHRISPIVAGTQTHHT